MGPKEVQPLPLPRRYDEAADAWPLKITVSYVILYGQARLIYCPAKVFGIGVLGILSYPTSLPYCLRYPT